MYVLGIETSCDETSASVVRDGSKIVSQTTISSLARHKKYGGIVPEIAFRRQLETIAQVSDNTLRESGLCLRRIGLVSVTRGPGLSGSLLVGVSFAKAISLSRNIPLIGVNHLYGHLYASFLTHSTAPKSRHLGVGQDAASESTLSNASFFRAGRVEGLSNGRIRFPFVGLVVSGGHTSLFYVRDFTDIKLIGSTQDDACGEAFDKVAKMMGLGYPGGPLIERLARNGNPKMIKLSCSNTNNPLDFSFSGIKTAVLYLLKDKKILKPQDKKDIAASFQEAVLDTLIKKSFLACRIKKTDRLVVGGGVIANSRLRDKFIAAAVEADIQVFFPDRPLSMDNAAMIAGLGFELFKRGRCSGLEMPLELN